MNIKINGQVVEVEEWVWKKLFQYEQLLAQQEQIKKAKKEVDKHLKDIDNVINDLFSDTDRRLNKNTIELLNPSGDTTLNTFTFTSSIKKPTTKISPQNIISLISEGIQNGYIIIGNEALTWLDENGFEVLEKAQEGEKTLSAIQVGNILDKTRTKYSTEQDKIEIKLK